MSGPYFLECLSGPNGDCFSSPFFLAPFALVALVAAGGYAARRADVASFRRVRRRALRFSTSLLILSLAAVGYFLIFDPQTVSTTDTSPHAQAVWAATVSGLGASVGFVAGALGLSLGGWIAKQVGRRERMNVQRLVIAIDGPAASGKGTLAKKVALHYALPCLDTGLLYRAVARDVIASGGELSDPIAAVAAAQALNAATLDDGRLRGPAAGDAASIVARIPEVRAALLKYQRAFARQPNGAVLDGRDIGTVVCPDADIKIFVTASAEERARRRHLEYQARGEATTYEDVLSDIRRRDARDSSRDISPMEPARDAVHLDTTALDADAAFQATLEAIEARRRGRCGKNV